MTITGLIYSRGSSNGANTVKSYNRFGSKNSVAIDAKSMGYMASPDEGYRESIKVSVTSGTTVLVSGVSNKKIEVDTYSLAASGACAVKFLSASTDITGPLTLAANGTIVNTDASIKTGIGEALSINLSASAVGGHLSYRLV